MIWTNLDLSIHTVTANDSSFESSLLQQGQTFTHTFTQPGEYAYYCQRHSGMAGRVLVTP